MKLLRLPMRRPTADTTPRRTPAATGQMSVAPTAFPWHPALFAAWIVISAWLDTAVSPFAALRAFLVALTLAAALIGIGWTFSRSLRLGGLFATGVLLVLWSRVPIEAVSGLLSRMGPLIGFAWLALVVTLAVLLVRRFGERIGTDSLTRLLNRGSGLLLMASLLLGVVGGRAAALLPDLAQGASLSALDELNGAASQVPDVYAILLDGYPRADALEYAFGLDNTPFVDALRERGFTVADRSHSDYLWTHVSVPSALNLAYAEQIPQLRSLIEGTGPRQPTLRRAVADGEIFELAHDRGYTTVSIASGFEEVAMRQADVYLDAGTMNEFEISLLTGTFAADLLSPVFPDLGSAQQRQRILYNFEVLPEIAGRTGNAPLFVIDHVPAPHQPTVFGRHGAPYANPLAPNWFADSPLERGEDPAEYRQRYRDQLPVINELVLDAIDGILDASSEPPVIIIFADHGSASAVDWNRVDPANADPARVLERTATLFAALTPGRDDVYPDDVSPVDIFRLLADAYWGTDYGRAIPPADGGHIDPIDESVFRNAASHVLR